MYQGISHIEYQNYELNDSNTRTRIIICSSEKKKKIFQVVMEKIKLH